MRVLRRTVEGRVRVVATRVLRRQVDALVVAPPPESADGGGFGPLATGELPRERIVKTVVLRRVVEAPIRYPGTELPDEHENEDERVRRPRRFRRPRRPEPTRPPRRPTTRATTDATDDDGAMLALMLALDR